MDPLEQEFDLLVIGTGLPESIIAAAASRIGKNVLHIDPNDYYGSYWSSFNLKSLQTYVESCKNNEHFKTNKLENIHESWREIDCDVDKEKEEILKEFRRFNIDITPKLMFSRGALVELLISSNISRYAEFRAVDHVLTIINDEIKIVPSSRSDVFNSKELNVIEKRMLMKLLTKCLELDKNSEEWKIECNENFEHFLKANNLSTNLIHYILYAIAMGNEKTTFEDGIENTKHFLNCLGRYGNSPFLFPMYGCGEIPQCFCRLCAVFGGIYCLQNSVEKLNFETQESGESVCLSVECPNQCLKAKQFVIGPGIIPKELLKTKSTIEQEQTIVDGISRGIFITSVPIGDATMNEGGGGVSFMKLDDAFVLQLSHYSGTCPKGYYLIHVTSKISAKPEEDIKQIINKLIKNQSDIIYSLYFNIPNQIHDQFEIANNLHFTASPEFTLDYDASIEKARTIFINIYPDTEFLPRAPDPEEIIIGEEENAIEVDENNVNAAVELMRENVFNNEEVAVDDAVDAVEDLSIQ